MVDPVASLSSATSPPDAGQASRLRDPSGMTATAAGSAESDTQPMAGVATAMVVSFLRRRSFGVCRTLCWREMDSNFQFRAEQATRCVIRDECDRPSAVISAVAGQPDETLSDGRGTLAGGARMDMY